jgi:transposase
VLILLEQQGKMDLFYGDESGFSLSPEIPYGWQVVNQPIRMKTAQSKRLNLFGLMARNNDLEAYMYEGSATSDLIIAFINDFAQRVVKKTTIILDNATVHRSKKFREKLVDWAALGIDIIYLPTYSPHLNIIETLWRKMKYEWLRPKDYESLDTLEAAIDNIILNFGTEIAINFSS